MLVYKYELFKMEQNESSTKLFARFIDIINDLKNLEKYYINNELVRKNCRSLSRAWKVKITTI